MYQGRSTANAATVKLAVAVWYVPTMGAFTHRVLMYTVCPSVGWVFIRYSHLTATLLYAQMVLSWRVALVIPDRGFTTCMRTKMRWPLAVGGVPNTAS